MILQIFEHYSCLPVQSFTWIKYHKSDPERKRWNSAYSYKRQKTIRFGEIRDSVSILDSVRDSDSVNCRFLIRIRDSRFGFQFFRFGFGIRDSVIQILDSDSGFEIRFLLILDSDPRFEIRFLLILDSDPGFAES